MVILCFFSVYVLAIWGLTKTPFGKYYEILFFFFLISFLPFLSSKIFVLFLGS